MDNRDIRSFLGEMLCGVIPDSAIKAVIHADMANDYKNEFELVTDIFDGKRYVPEIAMATLHGAKEGYKQHNKSILETLPLSFEKKKEVSTSIDNNAESLLQQWICKFKNMGIRIL